MVRKVQHIAAFMPIILSILVLFTDGRKKVNA